MSGLTVVVVDDDISIRDAFATLLSLDGHRVVPFNDGQAFLDHQGKVQPDLVLLDFQMPRATGLDVLRQLEHPLDYPIVMISAHGDVTSAVESMKLGATDFIEKPITPEQLDATIKMARELPTKPVEPAEPASIAALSELTARENEVAAILVSGATNKLVAKQLDLSPRTVEVHRANIFKKLKVRNLAGLIALVNAKAR